MDQLLTDLQRVLAKPNSEWSGSDFTVIVQANTAFGEQRVREIKAEMQKPEGHTLGNPFASKVA